MFSLRSSSAAYVRVLANPNPDLLPSTFASCLPAGSSVGNIANTGSFKQTSTSRSVCIDESRAASKYRIASPSANPPPNPPPANSGFLGNDGLIGRLGGSSTRNCSPCCCLFMFPKQVVVKVHRVLVTAGQFLELLFYRWCRLNPPLQNADLALNLSLTF